MLFAVFTVYFSAVGSCSLKVRQELDSEFVWSRQNWRMIWWMSVDDRINIADVFSTSSVALSRPYLDCHRRPKCKRHSPRNSAACSIEPDCIITSAACKISWYCDSSLQSNTVDAPTGVVSSSSSSSASSSELLSSIVASFASSAFLCSVLRSWAWKPCNHSQDRFDVSANYHLTLTSVYLVT